MNRFPLTLIVAAGILASGCGSMAPRTSARLDEARVANTHMQGDVQVGRFAPMQARLADEALERAVEAANTLQDPALVDHLAYVARQRAAIARETATRVAAEQRLDAARLTPTGGRS